MDIALIFVVSSLEDSFDDVSTARIHKEYTFEKLRINF